MPSQPALLRALLRPEAEEVGTAQVSSLVFASHPALAPTVTELLTLSTYKGPGLTLSDRLSLLLLEEVSTIMTPILQVRSPKIGINSRGTFKSPVSHRARTWPILRGDFYMELSPSS